MPAEEGTGSAAAEAVEEGRENGVGEGAVLPEEDGGGGGCAQGHPVAGGSREIAVHDEGRSAGLLPVQRVCGADGGGRAHPCVVGDDGAGDGGGLYEARHGDVVGADGAAADGGGDDEARHRADRVRLWIFHGRAGTPLRGGDGGGGGAAGVVGQERAADPDHEGLRVHGADLHAVVRDVSGGADREDGGAERDSACGWGCSAARRGRTRCARRWRRGWACSRRTTTG